jgi:hypothetical protein
MAWNDLATNQMVSYLDASTSGFILKSGQSNFTTLPAANQCMTKDDALAKYILDSSYMSTYASNELVPKSTWVRAVLPYSWILYYSSSPSAPNYVGFENSTGACSATSPAVPSITVYSNSYLQNGLALYYDQYGVTPINCNSYDSTSNTYYKLDTYAITFENAGEGVSNNVIHSYLDCIVPSYIDWTHNLALSSANTNLTIYKNSTLVLDNYLNTVTSETGTILSTVVGDEIQISNSANYGSSFFNYISVLDSNGTQIAYDSSTSSDVSVTFTLPSSGVTVMASVETS